MGKDRPSIIKLSNKYGHDPLHYPIKALAYTVSHPSLLKIVLDVAWKGCTLALVSFGVLLGTTLKPQARWISSNLYWWSWPIAGCMVLFESTLCAGLILLNSKSRAQKKLFVATMREEEMWKEDIMVSQSSIADLALPTVGKEDVVKFVTIPIQLIPLFGGIAFSAINATFNGWDLMRNYFKAVQLSSKLQRSEVFGEEHMDKFALIHPSTYDINNDYARLGFMAGLLESIPIVGVTVFSLTNAIAAALFACDIERSGGLVCLKKTK